METNLNQKIRDAISIIYSDKKRNYDSLCFLADFAIKSSFGNRNIPENGQDLIDKITEALLTGKRRWNIEKYPDAYSQILFILKNSEIFNMRDKYKRFEKNGLKVEFINNDDMFHENGPKDESAINNFTKNNYFPDKDELKEWCDEAMKKCKDDECGKIYSEILNSRENKNINKQLAKKFGITENEVVTKKKRLCKYLLKSVEAKNQKEQKIYVKTGSK